MRLKLMLSFFLLIIFSIVIGGIVISTPERTIIVQNYTHPGKLERIEQLNFKPVENQEQIVNDNAVVAKINNASTTTNTTIKSSPSRNQPLSTSQIFTVTAYDLSVQSCGKEIGHPNYGLTASGFNLTGLSRTDAMSIAVDTQVIPMGSQVQVTFVDTNYAQYNGIYTARDTGGAIKGYKIDLFMGDFQSNEASQEAINFGTPKAEVIVLQ